MPTSLLVSSQTTFTDSALWLTTSTSLWTLIPCPTAPRQPLTSLLKLLSPSELPPLLTSTVATFVLTPPSNCVSGYSPSCMRSNALFESIPPAPPLLPFVYPLLPYDALLFEDQRREGETSLRSGRMVGMQLLMMATAGSATDQN